MPRGPTITSYRNVRLSGRIRFVEIEIKRGFFRQPARILQMQVQEKYESTYSECGQPHSGSVWREHDRWIDATCLDLANPALRWLIDGTNTNKERHADVA